MFNRRDFLQGGAAIGFGAIGASAGLIRAVYAQNAANPALKAVFDTAFNDLLKLSPGLCTAIGSDKGEFAYQKSKLDHSDKAARDRAQAFVEKTVSALKAIPRSSLSGMDRINYDTVSWDYTTQLEGIKKFKGTASVGAPYVVSQLTGAYQSIPDFLNSQHSIENKDDAEAYISRLDEYAKLLNEETANFVSDAKIGLLPPDFVLKRALEQLGPMTKAKAGDNVLVKSLVAKLKANNIEGNYAARATKIVDGQIRAALSKQAQTLKSYLPKSVHDAGIWRLPDGEARYAYAAKVGTTSSMTPDEIHKLGLAKVEELSARIDEIFKSQGMTQGSVGQRMAALNKDPKQLYDNNDAAKEDLLKYLNTLVDGVYKKVPEYFNVLPKAKVQIKRVPKDIEAGAPGGYYNAPALDGSRPGMYYINLRDTAEQAKWLLPTLTYHEAVPGHHFQISIQQEAPLPMVRKLSGFNAYVEGWALYSEELANEMGMYENDPWGKIGFLHDAMFRAVRLVVDTGMHSKRWSREKAIAYMSEHTGDVESAATTEIERYCVWPGQALGYMVGKIQWLKIRSMMQAHMGAKYSIKDFHDAGLLAGAVPLDVLEQVYRDKGYIA